MRQKNNPKISIITICLNDPKGLLRTIKSVANLDYKNHEHIIVDGGSELETIDLIKSNSQRIARWVSESDSGIYDAMNKGISMADGQWLIFMNAGDCFASNKVLDNIELDLKYSIVYGNNVSGKKKIYPRSPKHLKYGSLFANHQAMFFNVALLGTDLWYDDRLKIHGDYELVNRIFLKYPNSFLYINTVIAICAKGGISQRISATKRKEKYMTVLKSYGLYGLVRAVFWRMLH